MKYLQLRIGMLPALLLLLCVVCCGAARAASLEEKLRAETAYVPEAAPPVEQLIDVAQRFKIPMAIEWVERAGTIKADTGLRARRRSVRELLGEIISVSPEHRVEVEGGLVHVYSTVAAVHPFNFLNFRLKSYDVNDDDLFAAEDQLRWAIRFTLEPEKYREGYVGGNGHGPGSVFEFPRFTLSGSDLTIREVLNQIALAQGNALWVATIRGEDLDGAEPYWKRKATDDEDSNEIYGWRFLPLAGIDELAREQVAIDVFIEGLLDKRMNTIPVMLEHGLTGDSGGATSGFTSEGDSYFYSARIEKAGKEFLTLALHLKVTRSGEAERVFERKLRVTNGRAAEFSPEPRIKIKAYFEPRGEVTDDRK
ncbi:MAG TPA: hypothetical protein VF735_15190 [Pyrinomonadaceae bacterium]|jgi:hypothetical protein